MHRPTPTFERKLMICTVGRDQPNPPTEAFPMSSSRLHHMRTCLLIAVATATLTLAGCHKKKGNINPASLGPTDTNSMGAESPTASITADPLAIDLGQSVVLNWTTTHAASVSIDGLGPVNPSGTQTVSPTTSTNYHLTAKGDGGTVEANVRVTVRTPTAPANTGANAGVVTDAAFHAAVQDAFFDYDSYDLRADAKQAVAQAAAFLAQHPTIRVGIGGYCDERGSAEYNVALGENRANSAKTALVNAGVAASRIRVVSYGKERQFCTESTEACYQENRRAQFTIDR